MIKYFPYIILLLGCSIQGLSQVTLESQQQTLVPSFFESAKLKKISKNDKSISSSSQKVLDDMELTIEGQSDFTAYYIKYSNSPLEEKDYAALLKAFEMNPDNTLLDYEMVKYYEYSDNKSSKMSFLSRMKSSSPQEILEYGKNLLESVEQNGMLVTYGELDTYPVWIAQEIDGFRRDVNILQYDLLMDNKYRARKKVELGLVLNSNYSDRLQVIRDIAQKNVSKKIYFSSAISPQLLKELKANLYCTGLAFKYTLPFENMSLLKSNWKKYQTYQMDKKQFSSKSKGLMMNYIYPIYLLSQSDIPTKEKEILKQIAINIAKQNNKEAQIKKMLQIQD